MIKFELKVPKNTPKEALDLFTHLQEKYPIHKPQKCYLEFQNGMYTRGGGRGLCSTSKNGDAFYYLALYVGLGWKDHYYSAREVCHTLAHEYKHALQHQEGEHFRTRIEPVFESQANEFAEQILKEFFNE